MHQAARGGQAGPCLVLGALLSGLATSFQQQTGPTCFWADNGYSRPGIYKIPPAPRKTGTLQGLSWVPPLLSHCHIGSSVPAVRSTESSHCAIMCSVFQY